MLRIIGYIQKKRVTVNQIEFRIFRDFGSFIYFFIFGCKDFKFFYENIESFILRIYFFQISVEHRKLYTNVIYERDCDKQKPFFLFHR